MPVRFFRNISLWTVGFIWALAGVSKLIEPLLGTPANEQATWISSFPSWMMISVAILECMIAILIFARFRWAPVIIGSALLTSFMIAIRIWPPAYQQPCGCFGKIEIFDTIDPVAKIILFGGLNTLAAALIWVCQPNGAPGTNNPLPIPS